MALTSLMSGCGAAPETADEEGDLGEVAQAYCAQTPDLIIRNITFTCTLPTVSVQFQMANIGGLNAAPAYAGVWIDGVAKPLFGPNGAPAGGFVPYAASFPIAAGAHTFRAMADATLLDPECDEVNNRTPIINFTCP
ncbi:MAG: hypothetical protein U0359_05030 [Byssovorax sp.]